MPYIDENVFRAACEVDLLTYFQRICPNDIVRRGKEYCLRSHDSLRMSNGLWNWHSRGIGGRSATDWLVRTQGYSIYDAVRTVIDSGCPHAVHTPEHSTAHLAQPKEPFELPEKHADNRRVFAYLTHRRGLDPEIINHHIKAGRLYESTGMHNAVFVGFDEGGTARYAMLHGTLSDKRFLGEQTSSDKKYAFRALYTKDDAPRRLRLFESPIDLISYQCIQKLLGQPWKDGDYLSLSGISNCKVLPESLACYLQQHPDTARIDFHLDADEAGRNAAKALYTLISTEYPHIQCKNYLPIEGKDINEWLVAETQKEQQIPVSERYVLAAAVDESHYAGKVVLLDENCKVFLGDTARWNAEYYYYDNTDGSLMLVSENSDVYEFLCQDAWEESQSELLEELWFSVEDFAEFARVQDSIQLPYREGFHGVTFGGELLTSPPKAKVPRSVVSEPVKSENPTAPNTQKSVKTANATSQKHSLER